LQDHLGASKGTLGLCLLCMAAGAFVSMPLTGHVLDRRPSASVTRWATLVFCLMLPLPLLATSPYMLGAILFVFGARNGAMAVARLGGDFVNARIGAGKLLRAGMALVTIALGGVLLIGETVPAVVGFALCGLGIANAVPLLFSAAGRFDPAGPSLAAAFTL